MKPIIHGIASIKVGSIGSRHIRLNVQDCAGEIEVIVAGTGHHELNLSSRLERGHGLMLHRATVDDVGLRRRYGEETELALDPLARLSMHERHRRICLVPDVSAIRSSSSSFSGLH